jgi:hypothetical protein
MGRDFHAVVMDDIVQRCGVGGARCTAARTSRSCSTRSFATACVAARGDPQSVGSPTPPAETLAAFVRAVLGHPPAAGAAPDRPRESKRGVAQTTWFAAAPRS